MEARRTAGLNNAPPCFWSPSPPQELEGVVSEAIAANAGYFRFGNARYFNLLLFVYAPLFQ